MVHQREKRAGDERVELGGAPLVDGLVLGLVGAAGQPVDTGVDRLGELALMEEPRALTAAERAQAAGQRGDDLGGGAF